MEERGCRRTASFRRCVGVDRGAWVDRADLLSRFLFGGSEGGSDGGEVVMVKKEYCERLDAQRDALVVRVSILESALRNIAQHVVDESFSRCAIRNIAVTSLAGGDNGMSIHAEPVALASSEENKTLKDRVVELEAAVRRSSA